MPLASDLCFVPSETCEPNAVTTADFKDSRTAPSTSARGRGLLSVRSSVSCLPWLLSFLVLLGAPAAAKAQERPAAPADTLERAAELQRSPRGAFFRSLVLPGWGQAWVGAPARGGVYFALETGSLWMTYKSRQKLREARREEEWLRQTGQLPAGQPLGLVRAREEQAEDWLTLAIFLMFFAGADAFVAAHLADFGDHIGVLPAPDGGLRLQATVPLRGRP
ncbi:hypothetical protein BH23GEM3_BH23GEM3_24030 [soil metagenome]